MRIRRIVLATVLAAMVILAVAGPAFAQEGPDNNNACKGKHKRACEIPEVPLAAAIPVVGLLAVAGYVLIDHRRHRRPSDSDAG